MSNNQQSSRLQLNFGGGDRNNQFQDAGRAFPTTPSTFPQPVYPNQAGQQEVWGAQQQQQPANGFSSGGYFPNPYQQAQYQGQQGNLQTQHLQQRLDANGLAQQLSTQHLGGSGRSGSSYGRQPSPNPQRPRTADNRGGYGYGSYSSSQGPRPPSLYDEEAPKRSPEKYSENVEKQATMSKSLINTFFKDSVQRARDRNQRYACTISVAMDSANPQPEHWRWSPS
jgi:protein-serine/threonine kinase